MAITESAPRIQPQRGEITPLRSQLSALWQCPLAGLVLAWLAVEAIDYWYPYAVMLYIKAPLAFAVFLLTAVSSYFYGLKNVPVRKRGVRLFLGKVWRGGFYGEGDHFLFPILNRLLITYGPTELIPYTVKRDAPEARDKIRVFIGHDRRAVILIQVLDPVRYIAAIRRGITLESSFLDQLRKFVNQMAYAVGIVDEKSILDEFVELPTRNDRDDSYGTFYAKLRELKVDIDGSPKEVFPKESADTVRRYFGTFRREAEELGIYIRNVFAPSIDLPEGIGRAAEATQAQREANRLLESKMGTIVSQAENLKAKLPDVTGPDALDRIGLATDQKVTREVRHERREYPGFPEVLKAGIEAIADAIKNRNKDQA